jgi:hypothetical protein
VLTAFELRQSALVPGHEVASWDDFNTDLPRMDRRSGIWLSSVLRRLVIYSETVSVHRQHNADGEWMIMHVKHRQNHS